MVLHFNGRYRKVKECDFLEQAEDELAKFHQNSCKPNSVLVFPPLKAHYRFLIHQLVGEDSRLHSVSIGEGQQRRTVVYFACARKTRRPDQQLYAPGALRQARWEQQEQKLSKEGAVKREENEIISTDNAAGADALSRSTVEEFSDKCFGQECDSRVDESKNVVDGTKGSGNIQDQQRNINCTSIQGISSGSLGRDDINQIDGKELKNEEVTTIARDSTMATSESAPCLTYITANNGSGSFDSQFLNTESNGDKFDEINYKGVIDGTGSLQISSTCADRDNGAAENSSADASEDFKMLKNKTCNGTDRMTLHNQCERASNETLVNELNQRQDDPLLKASKGLLVKEKTNHRNGIKSKVPEDGKVKSDRLSEVVAGVDANHDGIAKVGNDEIRTVMKSVSYSDVPMTYGSYAVDCIMEKIQNKIIGPESVQQSALSSSATQEYTESNFGTNVLTLCEQMPAAALTDTLQETSGGRTVSKDYYPRDQHITVNRHPQDVSENANRKFEKTALTALALSDLTGSYSLRTRTEEVTDKVEVGTSQVDYNSEGKDTVNSANDRDTSSENTNTNCLVEINREVETVSCDFGGRNLDKMSDGLEGNSEVMRENIEASSGKVEDGSDPNSVIYVSKTNNEQKPETSKKKKSKKDKSIKEKTDEKTKSKEKGEKKKKKEKKGEKTEKSDKNTEESVNKGKKLKATVLSDKQDERDLNTCDREVREELSTSTKAGEKSQSNSNDDGGDDSDNWESFYDESGDCLNPEQLEELSRLTGIDNPEVQKTQYDFYSFTPRDVELDDEEFGHIVEIYNFSPDLKTQDLMQALSMFRSKGFDIKWVDDTHALGIFSSHISAQEAIKLCSSPLMKLRPVSQGTPESRKKATNCFEFLQPYKERPQTSKLLADRLVTGALGMRSKLTREDRVKEREKLKEAKNKKQQEDRKSVV